MIINRVKFFLKITVSLFLLWMVFRRLDWTSIISIGRHIGYTWLLPLIILLPLGIFISSLRWYFILKEFGLVFGLPTIFILLWSSSFLNTCLPGSTGGDLYRFIFARNCYNDKTVQITSSLMIDRLFGLVSLLFIGVFSLLLVDRNTLTIFGSLNFSISQFYNYIYIIIFIVFFTLIISLKLFLSCNWFGKIIVFIKKLLSHIYFIFYNKILIVNITICSFSIHIITLTTSYCISRTLGLNIPFFDLAIFITILALVVSVPISVNGLGLREALLVGYFQLHAYKCGNAIGSKESALAFSLLSLSCDIMRVLPGGIFLILSKDKLISDLKS